MNKKILELKVNNNKKDFEKQFSYDGLIDLINRSSENKKLYIIDSYRTPIERKISSFFQNINNWSLVIKIKAVKS